MLLAGDSNDVATSDVSGVDRWYDWSVTGYNFVTTIPAGATQLDIRQYGLEYVEDDDNYLGELDDDGNYLGESEDDDNYLGESVAVHFNSLDH